MTQYVIRLKGGPGSGNHGHKGIPGHQGGSLPKGESTSGRQTDKLNRREVHDANDKPGDLPGIRTRIPNADGELSHGSDLFTDLGIKPDPDKDEIESILWDNIHKDNAESAHADDDYEQLCDNIAKKLFDISEQLRKRKGVEADFDQLFRYYKNLNNLKFTKQQRNDMAYVLSIGYDID